jgi:hypothetical protein
MQNSDRLSHLPLAVVIDAIASDNVAPGAGSAAAVALALAAACAGKAVSVTLKKRADDVELAQAREALTRIAHQALEGAEADAHYFREFIREQDVHSAQDLLDAGKRLQHLGLVLLTVLARIEPRIDTVVQADLSAARALWAGFSEIQSENLAETRDAATRVSDAQFGEPDGS